MTWLELVQQIAAMTEDQKQTDVTVKVGDEYLPMASLDTTTETDVLDEGHPYLSSY